jgi:hypothetical protein
MFVTTGERERRYRLHFACRSREYCVLSSSLFLQGGKEDYARRRKKKDRYLSDLQVDKILWCIIILLLLLLRGVRLYKSSVSFPLTTTDRILRNLVEVMLKGGLDH